MKDLVKLDHLSEFISGMSLPGLWCNLVLGDLNALSWEKDTVFVLVIHNLEMKNKNTENIVVVLVIGPLILLNSHGSRPLSASFLIRTSGKDDSQSRAW